MFMSEDKVKEILSEPIAYETTYLKVKETWLVFLLFMDSEWPEGAVLAIWFDFYRGNSGKEKIFFLFKKYNMKASIKTTFCTTDIMSLHLKRYRSPVTPMIYLNGVPKKDIWKLNASVAMCNQSVSAVVM